MARVSVASLIHKYKHEVKRSFTCVSCVLWLVLGLFSAIWWVWLNGCVCIHPRDLSWRDGERVDR